MEQEPLWHESFESALWSTAEAIGPKRIAAELWPEKPVDEATRQLARCCDPDRAEKLSASQIALIIERGRQQDCHVAIAYLCERGGYAPPQPLEPEDERARLQREFIEAQRHFDRLVKRMERLG